MPVRLLQIMALVGLFFASGAYAGYAQLAPPSGWVGGAGAASTFSYPSAANAATFSNGTVLTNASLNVGGRAVQVPASMRIAANAGRVAAAAIYLHPALRTAAAVATWVGAAGFVYDMAKGWQVPEQATVSDGYAYYAVDRTSAGAAATPEAAAEFWVAYQNQMNGNLYKSELSGSCEPFGSSSQTRCPFTDTDVKTGYSYVRYAAVKRSAVCPAGWFHTPAGCIQNPPMKTVTKEEFERMVPDARPMPSELPGVVWPASWPVEVPEVQPTFIPTGNPVPNPKYDPSAPPSTENQPFVQPGVNVRPAPSPSSPWQVDLQPVNRPTSNPKPGSDPVPDTNPDGSPKPDPGDKPREDNKEDRDFCDKHPDVLACKKIELDTPEGEIPKKQIDVTWSPIDLGLGGGSCPAPVQIYEDKQFSYQFACDNLYIIKPLVIAIALFVGGMIIFGGRADQ